LANRDEDIIMSDPEQPIVSQSCYKKQVLNP
jgi:hypothetical protein